MSLYDVNEEKILVDKLKLGDESAFSAIYSLLSPGLIRYVFKKLGDLDGSRDIVHDIFTKLWDSRTTLEIQSSLSAYLYRQALNRCLNVFRHQKVTEAHLHSLLDFMETAPKSADSKILDAEFNAIIAKEVGALPPKMREAIELRLHHGFSNKEISQQMEISEHTVATHMKRALRILRSKIRFTVLILYLFLFAAG